MQKSLLSTVLTQFATKPSGKSKPKMPTTSLADFAMGPLKVNWKKDILTRAQKLAPQKTLQEIVYTVVQYFNKHKLSLENFVKFDQKLYNDYNNLDHSERVLLFATYIAIAENVTPRGIQVLIDSAKLHDVGKTSFVSDLSHGQKGADLIKKYNLTNFEKNNDFMAVLALVDAHSAYDKNVEGILNKYEIDLTNYEKVKKLCYILKDAELLDKVRVFNLPNITQEDLPKVSMLRTKSAKTGIVAAFELLEFYNNN